MLDKTSPDTDTNATSGNENPESGKPEPKPTTTDNTPTDPRVETARKESAAYRTKLRKTEAERDQLQTRLDALEKQAINQHLPEGLPAEAFWLATDQQPGQLLNEDATINTDALTAATKAAITKLGLKPKPNLHQLVPTEGKNPRRHPTTNQDTQWANMIQKEIRPQG